MPAIHVRNVPERVAAALRERAELHGVSLQEEVPSILREAAQQPVRSRRLEPIRLVTVKTSKTSSWRREDTYGAAGR